MVLHLLVHVTNWDAILLHLVHFPLVMLSGVFGGAAVGASGVMIAGGSHTNTVRFMTIYDVLDAVVGVDAAAGRSLSVW